MRRWLLVGLRAVAGLLVVGGGAWWWQQAGHSTPAVSAAESVPPSSSLPLTVTVAQPTQATLRETLTLTGAVVPMHEVLVTSDLNGIKVMSLLAEEGDTVREGQVLARLDTESLRYQLQQLDAQRQRSEDEFRRLDRIKQTGAVSTDQLSEKWLAFQSSLAQYNDLKLKLERAAILAPASGVIYERGVASGALLVGGEVLFRIAADGKSEVELQVPETRLSQLAQGQNGAITLAAGETLAGKVRRITPRIDPTQRTAAVRISLPDDRFYPVGVFATVTLQVAEHQGLTLPLTALLKDADGEFVWTVVDGKAQVQRIAPRFRNDMRVIVEGIPPTAAAVVSAGAFLQEGDTVNTVQSSLP